ncbi:hypothetical protein [Zeaxanthinibacter enoshimensis]
MKHCYPQPVPACRLVKARPDTISFLLSYSRSLHVSRHKDLVFTNHKN